ncbi:hypothetical protein [Lyngbya aestuarii]|uniref:hypothetical protein n=1 Tax=Lyngbya aestuarii TaxID=118322 RepID=UPI00403E2481
MVYNASSQVRITKGMMKGHTGKIAACNSDGFYFILGSWDTQKTGCSSIWGPFLSDEIEPLDSL